MVKRLLKKYDYPPEGMEDAIKTVLRQCEMWTDHTSFYQSADYTEEMQEPLMVAEEKSPYGKEEC